jgi:hypothetical protein
MLFFILDGNDLTGPIPSELGLLASLSYLDLGKSFLSFYCVPLCYEYIHDAWIIFLILDNNALTGLPDTFRAWMARRVELSRLA